MRAHDRLQLELKFEYPAPNPLESAFDYDVDLWFFMPHAAGVEPADYGPAEFYADLRNYTRMKTPELSLEDLSSPDGAQSPLVTLRLLRDRIGPGGPSKKTARAVEWEARLLCCIFKSTLRGLLHDCAARLSAGEAAEAMEIAAHFTDRADRLTVARRAFMRDPESRGVRKNTKRCLRFCDESLSVQIDGAWVRLLELLEDLEQGCSPELRAGLQGLARRKANRRAGMEYRSADDDQDSGSVFLDQAKLLKKYTSEVLWLEAREHKGAKSLEHLAFGLAAGLAMVRTVGLQVAALFRLGLELNSTVTAPMVAAFCAIAVFGYMLKDRIKSVTGRVLTSRIPKLLYDHRFDLFSGEAEKPVGTIRDHVAFVDAEWVPPAVREMRDHEARSPLALRTEQHVLHDRRAARVHPRSAALIFPRSTGLSDILRLNLWRWIRTLAARRAELHTLDRKGRPRRRKVRNVYCVELYVRYRPRHAEVPAAIQRLELVLDRAGLQSVRSGSPVIGEPALSA